jgi:hypothetical protein
MSRKLGRTIEDSPSEQLRTTIHRYFAPHRHSALLAAIQFERNLEVDVAKTIRCAATSPVGPSRDIRRLASVIFMP